MIGDDGREEMRRKLGRGMKGGVEHTAWASLRRRTQSRAHSHEHTIVLARSHSLVSSRL